MNAPHFAHGRELLVALGLFWLSLGAVLIGLLSAFGLDLLP
jgi:hypothetical protein